MHVEATGLYRVRALAEALDVSVATIYRAVESGALRAVRLGKGKGAVRIPGEAITEYLAACERAAAKTPTSRATPGEQLVCVICGTDIDASRVGRYVVGRAHDGSYAFACETHQLHSPSPNVGGAA